MDSGSRWDIFLPAYTLARIEMNNSRIFGTSYRHFTIGTRLEGFAPYQAILKFMRASESFYLFSAIRGLELDLCLYSAAVAVASAEPCSFVEGAECLY